jgi:predicted Zn-dependent peptidase
MLADDPQEVAHVLMDETLWPNQALGREVAGTRQSVLGLQRHDLRRYLSTYYGPNNCVIAVAGGVVAEEIAEMIERYFGDWSPVTPDRAAPARIPPETERARSQKKPTEQVHLCLSFPGMYRNHPDQWAMDVLCTVLGTGTSSRLFVELRERLGLAYDVHAFTSHYSDTGSVAIYAGMEAQNLERVVESVLFEVERLRRRRVTIAELSKARQYYRGRLWLGLEDTHSVASWFGAQELLEEQVVTPESAASAIEAVTADDVLRVARAYLDPSRLRIAAVGAVDDRTLDKYVRQDGA